MILLTGYKGYIGSHLSKMFPEAFMIDIFGDAKLWNSLFEEASEITDDLHAIIHCGAIADSQYQEPDIFFWNYETTRRLANLAKERACLFVFISSCTAIEPHTFYGYSKRVAEDYIRANNNAYCILRPYNVYGDEDHGREERYSVPEKLNRRILKHVFFPFRRDYIHVRDVVSAVKQVVQYSITGTYDLGTGRCIEVKFLAELTDPNFYTVTDVKSVLGANHPPIELKARKSKMLPNFHAHYDVLTYMS